MDVFNVHTLNREINNMPRPLKTIALLLILNITTPVSVADQALSVDNEDRQVKVWNAFAVKLYQLHRRQTKGKDIAISRRQGGYGGEMFGHISYTESTYTRRDNNRIISRLRKIKGESGDFHTLEVYIHDKNGRVTRDYSVSYLPVFRNAPYQTLINFHYYADDLHAYRQFDALGRRIFESCRGQVFDEKVEFLLEDYEIPDHVSELKGALRQEAYHSCFDQLPAEAGVYLDPLAEITASSDHIDTHDLRQQLESRLASHNRALSVDENNTNILLKRADVYLQLHEFEKAVVDYTKVIELDAAVDAAYFGRGMALGRAGELEAAISDLSEYIKRNPGDSRAYTKRGVRYIWHGKLGLAQADLLKAIAIDHRNAEAHDDLGVIYAQKKQYKAAINHFQEAIKYDPEYQKAYHNLAMTYYINNQMQQSLEMASQALSMQPDNRDSLMLKGMVLQSLGRDKEAAALIGEAEFLPEGNWTERFALD